MAVFILFGFLGLKTTLAITPEEQEAIWRAELVETEKDIAKWKSILDSTKSNTKSLQTEAAALNAKIKQAQATIKQKNINIQQLTLQIKDKQKDIAKWKSILDSTKSNTKSYRDWETDRKSVV